MSLSDWPGFQGLRVVLLWVVLVFVVFGWRYYWGATRAIADEAARPIFSITAPLLIAFGPPLVLAVAISVFRKRSGKP